jgi:hypothetical protein
MYLEPLPQGFSNREEEEEEEDITEQSSFSATSSTKFEQHTIVVETVGVYYVFISTAAQYFMLALTSATQ